MQRELQIPEISPEGDLRFCKPVIPLREGATAVCRTPTISGRLKHLAGRQPLPVAKCRAIGSTENPILTTGLGRRP